MKNIKTVHGRASSLFLFGIISVASLLSLVGSLLYSHTAYAAPAFVQYKFNIEGSGGDDDLTATFNSNNTAGNIIIVSLIWDSATSPVTVTDTQNNTYTSVGTAQANQVNTSVLQTFYAKNITSGSNTVTATFPSGTSYRLIFAHEYAGIDTVDPVDVSNIQPGAGVNINIPAITTTNSVSLLYSAVATEGGINGGSSGYTLRGNDAGNITQDKLVSTTGTYSATTTHDATNWIAQHIAFKAAPPSAPVITTPIEGAVMSDTTPTISGTGEADAQLILNDKFGNTLCSLTVPGDGNWSCDTPVLSEGKHTFTARQTNASGDVSPYSADRNITVDVETDGVSVSIENAAPNGGDGNGDGILDSEQGNVTSIPNTITGGYNTLVSSGGGCENITSLSVEAASDLPKQDTTHTYPMGLWDFRFRCLNSGGTSTVKVFLDKLYDTSNWVYRKYNTLTQSYATIPVTYGTATVGSSQVTTISFSITDGGPLDEDGVADGFIHDPSGPSIALVDIPGAPNAGAQFGIIIDLILVIAGITASIVICIFSIKKARQS